MVSIGPFQKLTHVNFPAGEQWVIIEGAHGIPDTNYVGESDNANNQSSFRVSTGIAFLSGPYMTLTLADDAWAAITDAGPTTNWRQLVHWAQSTAHPTPPANYLDWDVVDSFDGYSPYGARFGRLNDGITPDPNCPPENFYNAGVAWNSSDAALNFLAWQQSLSTVHNSFTVIYVPFGGGTSEISCTPGAP